MFVPRKIHDNENLLWENGDKDFYRVFGEWRCGSKNCKNKWTSAFTWVLLSKWEAGYPIKRFSKEEYSQQECKKCKNKSNKIFKIQELKKKEKDFAEERKPHLAHLCAKCKKGDYCQDGESYFGY